MVFSIIYFLSSNIDLSFNNIEVIEGLNALTKLEDLTLYNNRIATLENMDTLLNLHVFSIGNNMLTELVNVRHAVYSTLPPCRDVRQFRNTFSAS